VTIASTQPFGTRAVCLLVAALAATLLIACGSDTTTTAVSTLPVTVQPPATADTIREGIRISTPAAEGVSDTALQQLVSDAKAQGSDAVVILANGKLIYENYFGGPDAPITAMSGSKSFVGLAFGFLLADHSIASLDDRVTNVLPTFAAVDARKADMTYRQLLSESSGLDPTRAGGTVGDIEQHGLASKTMFPPGSGWQYSNNGVDLLAALAGRLANEPMDAYLLEKLFTPMGIHSVSWIHDPNGVPLGAGEMSIRPLDLAKVGEMILDGGVWQGKTILPDGWMATSTATSTPYEPDYGLLWWRLQNLTSVGLTENLLAQWRWMGVADSTIAKLQPLTTASYTSTAQLYADVAARLTPTEDSTLVQWLTVGDHIPGVRILTTGPLVGFAAEGWLGQYLAIFPDKHLVAVRMRRALADDYTRTTEINAFSSFPAEAYHLIP
jgi:CubicO group peptidase (beta-lactamase class C family)